jgi:hypothetical protein
LFLRRKITELFIDIPRHMITAPVLTFEKLAALKEEGAAAMYHAYWFGVTYTFRCPECQEINFQHVAINVETMDLAKLNQRINREDLFCQFCQAHLPDGVPVEVESKLDTPQSLKNQGFPLPDDI